MMSNIKQALTNCFKFFKIQIEKQKNYKINFYDNRIAAFFLILIFIIGCLGSLKVVLGLFAFDVDSSHSLMLWYGVNSFGLSWLKDWLFTPDNWLFSLVPIHFLEFLIFGVRPMLVILTGWFIFMLSALVSGLIAWQLKAKRSAFLIPLMLIFVGFYAHSKGYVSYSTSHNITNLFGLISLSLLIQWFKNRQSIFLLFILFFLVAGALSDPWLIGTYNLPIVLVSLILWLFPVYKTNRTDFIKLFFVSTGSIIVVQTQFFGMLNFLPKMQFLRGSWNSINSNFVFLIKDLGALLNIFPFHASNDFIPGLVSIIVIGALIAKSINIIFIKSSTFPEFNFFAFSLFVIISTGGIILAFVLTSVPAANYSARFLLNVLYLIVIILGVSMDLHWGRFSTALRSVFTSVVILFLVSGVVSNLHLWKNFSAPMKNENVYSLIDFLRKNNLSYGYGPYWGSQANAVTAVSKLEIRIRPVVFNKANGMMEIGTRAESSKRWYTPEDTPPNQKEYFVLLKNDGEECSDIDLCVKGLTKQYGKPSKLLQYNDAFIMVWNHPLIDYYEYCFNEKIYFNTNGLGSKYCIFGWSGAESWGTWSDGDSSLLVLKIPHIPKSDLNLLIEGHAFLAEKHPFQEIDVYLKDHYLTTLKYTLLNNGGIKSIKIPKAFMTNEGAVVSIKFKFKNPKSPAELGLSADTRRLGLGIVSLVLKTVN